MATGNERLQRTLKGEVEIRKKSHVLTQSQRLILAAVDGISLISDLQRKLGGMAKRRFTLAIADLTARGLVEESTDEMSVPVKLETKFIEKFVRQDPLDPVTITSLHLQPMARAKAKPGLARSATPASGPANAKVAPDRMMEVDFYIPLESKQKDATPPVWKAPGEANLITTNGEGDEDEASPSRRRERRAQRARQVQIGYWLLFAGVVCGIVFLVSLRH